MFERYSEKARRVIFFGRYEASQFGSPQIETEHLLLGILREDKALCNRLLKPVGAGESIRKAVEQHSTPSKKVSTSVDMPLSNEGKRVLAYAAEEGERLGHKYIEVFHLLLGLLREENCFAAQLLHQHGIRLSAARELLAKSAREDPPVSGAEAAIAKAFKSLDDLGVALSRQAADGVLSPLIGRERELDRVVQVLCRFKRGNPVLVGEPGVGRKSIVHGLAYRIAEGNVPERLENSSLISLDLAVITSGTRSRARFEAALESVLDQIMAGDGILFYISDLHSFAESQRFLSIVNVIKPGLLSGSIQCVSTATPAEHRKTLEIAPWMEPLFTVVEVRPSSEAETLDVLRGLKRRFEEFHGVVYSDEALQYAVFHSSSYFRDRHLPEKAVDLIDEAAARAKLRRVDFPEEIKELNKQIKSIQYRQETAIANHEFEKARFFGDELSKERAKLKALKEKHKIPDLPSTVTREDVEQVVAERTGVFLELLRKSRVPGPQGNPKD